MKRVALPLLLAAFAWGSSSCAPSGFADPTQIKTVRVMASGATEPYARPGDEVTIELLADDGRSSKPEPMKLSLIHI